MSLDAPKSKQLVTEFPRQIEAILCDKSTPVLAKIALYESLIKDALNHRKQATKLNQSKFYAMLSSRIYRWRKKLHELKTQGQESAVKRIKWNNQPPMGEQKMVLPVQTQQNTTPHRNKLFTLFCIANLGNDDPRVSLHHFDQHYLHVIDNDYTISNFEKLGIYYFLLQEAQLSKQHFFIPQYLHRISMLSQCPFFYVPVLRLKPEIGQTIILHRYAMNHIFIDVTKSPYLQMIIYNQLITFLRQDTSLSPDIIQQLIFEYMQHIQALQPLSPRQNGASELTREVLKEQKTVVEYVQAIEESQDSEQSSAEIESFVDSVFKELEEKQSTEQTSAFTQATWSPLFATLQERALKLDDKIKELELHLCKTSASTINNSMKRMPGFSSS